MAVIILDSSPLLDDRPLSKPTTRALLDAAEAGDVRVIVPRVVLEEVVNAARGSFEDAAKAVAKANYIVGRQLAEPEQIDEPDVERLTEQFREEMEGALAEHNVELAEHDGVAHTDVVARDLAKRKPFDGSGRGYRDALIWHTVAATEEPSVIFVTRNTKDFADEQDPAQLHPSLIAELDEAREVRIVGSLAEVYELLGDLREDLRDDVESALEKERYSLGLQVAGEVSLPLPHGMENRDVTAEITEVNVDSVYYAWGVIAATVTARLEFAYAGTLDEWAWEDQANRLDANLVEWMEDSHTAVVSGDGSEAVVIEIAYDPSTGSVELLSAETV